MLAQSPKKTLAGFRNSTLLTCKDEGERMDANQTPESSSECDSTLLVLGRRARWLINNYRWQKLTCTHCEVIGALPETVWLASTAESTSMAFFFARYIKATTQRLNWWSWKQIERKINKEYYIIYVYVKTDCLFTIQGGVGDRKARSCWWRHQTCLASVCRARHPVDSEKG